MGPRFIPNQIIQSPSAEATQVFTQLLRQLRARRAQPSTLELDQSLDTGSANTHEYPSTTFITEGPTTTLAPPPGLGPRIVRTVIPLPSFEVPPCVELLDSPAGATAAQDVQARSPERSDSDLVRSMGSEFADMRDTSAQLVNDSPYTIFHVFTGSSQEGFSHFVDETTGATQMMDTGSDYWSLEANDQRIEGALRFSHRAQSFLNDEDSFLSREDGPDRHPSPMPMTVSPRRLFNTPSRYWGAASDTQVDDESWTQEYYGDELQNIDDSSYGNRYNFMSSPIVRNPPGSVAPPGILGHIHNSDVSGEVSFVSFLRYFPFAERA